MKRRRYVEVGEGFGKRLAALRKAKKLSQVEFGKLVGATQRMISNYERKNGRPRSDLIGEMARVLDVDVDDLIMSRSERRRAEADKAVLWRKLRDSHDLEPGERKTARRVIKDLLNRL